MSLEAAISNIDGSTAFVISLVGDLPKIELFARQKTDGWDAWGNEV